MSINVHMGDRVAALLATVDYDTLIEEMDTVLSSTVVLKINIDVTDFLTLAQPLSDLYNNLVPVNRAWCDLLPETGLYEIFNFANNSRFSLDNLSRSMRTSGFVNCYDYKDTLELLRIYAYRLSAYNQLSVKSWDTASSIFRTRRVNGKNIDSIVDAVKGAHA